MISAASKRSERLMKYRTNPTSSSSLSPSSTTLQQTTYNIKTKSSDQQLINLNSQREVIPDDVLEQLREAQSVLTVRSPKEKEIGDIDKAIDDVVNFIVHYTNDAMYGKDSFESKWFSVYGRVFVVEEIDGKIVRDGKLCKGYGTNAGQIAGLSRRNASYRRRIHLLVDGSSGVYGSDLLGQCYHYQLCQSELKAYLKDVYTSGRASIRVAGSSSFMSGKDDEAGICRISSQINGQHDCIIYTGITSPFVLTNTVDFDGVDEETKGEVRERPCFFSVNGPGVDELEILMRPLRMESYYKYLSNNINRNEEGALARNLQSTVSHGYSAMNCKNKAVEELHNLPSPHLTQHNYTRPGVDNGENMGESCRKAMVGMTEMLDAMSGLFDLPQYFTNNERNKIYAHKIDPKNRAEHFAASINANDNLGCHTDRQNGKGRDNSMNLTAWEYVRNPERHSPTDRDALVRVNFGICTRAICDSTVDRALKINGFLHDLGNFMDELPPHQKQTDVELLKLMPDDIATMYSDTVVARDPHVNKSDGYYTFFVVTISRWIEKRRRCGVPVCFPELCEALLTAVRWTPSPSTWAYVFEMVTDETGICIRLPEKLSLSPTLQIKVDENGYMERMESYKSPLPLFVQYALASIDLTGGVAMGGYKRFQPSAGLVYIDVGKELRSLKNLRKLVNKLIESTYHLVKNEMDPTSNEDLAARANKLRATTLEFVKQSAKPLDNGGVLGFGELIGHHYINILSLGGWVDMAHSLNTTFSRGNGTEEFLMITYGLDVRKIPCLIDAVSQAPFFECYGLHARNVSENASCKMGQEYLGDDNSSRQGCFDTRDIGIDSFLILIENGKGIAQYADRMKMEIHSGTYRKPKAIEIEGVLNLAVPSEPMKALAVHYYSEMWWWSTDYNLTDIFSGNTTFPVKDHRYTDRGVKTKQTARKRASPASSHPLLDNFGNAYGDPSKKWGMVNRKTQRQKSVIYHAARNLCLHVIQQGTIEAFGLGRNCTSNLQRLIEEQTRLDVAKVQELREEMDRNFAVISDAEDVNEIHRQKTDDIFSEVWKQIRGTKPVGSLRGARTRSNATISQHQREMSSLSVRLPQEYVIEDPKDDPYDNPLNCQLNSLFFVQDGRTLPTAHSIDILLKTNGRTFDFVKEIQDLTLVRQVYPDSI